MCWGLGLTLSAPCNPAGHRFFFAALEVVDEFPDAFGKLVWR